MCVSAWGDVCTSHVRTRAACSGCGVLFVGRAVISALWAIVVGSRGVGDGWGKHTRRKNSRAGEGRQAGIVAVFFSFFSSSVFFFFFFVFLLCFSSFFLLFFSFFLLHFFSFLSFFNAWAGHTRCPFSYSIKYRTWKSNTSLK